MLRLLKEMEEFYSWWWLWIVMVGRGQLWLVMDGCGGGRGFKIKDIIFYFFEYIQQNYFFFFRELFQGIWKGILSFFGEVKRKGEVWDFLGNLNQLRVFRFVIKGF